MDDSTRKGARDCGVSQPTCVVRRGRIELHLAVASSCSLRSYRSPLAASLVCAPSAYDNRSVRCSALFALSDDPAAPLAPRNASPACDSGAAGREVCRRLEHVRNGQPVPLARRHGGGHQHRTRRVGCRLVWRPEMPLIVLHGRPFSMTAPRERDARHGKTVRGPETNR
jgi:hypothetical protein